MRRQSVSDLQIYLLRPQPVGGIRVETATRADRSFPIPYSGRIRGRGSAPERSQRQPQPTPRHGRIDPQHQTRAPILEVVLLVCQQIASARFDPEPQLRVRIRDAAGQLRAGARLRATRVPPPAEFQTRHEECIVRHRPLGTPFQHQAHPLGVRLRFVDQTGLGVRFQGDQECVGLDGQIDTVQPSDLLARAPGRHQHVDIGLHLTVRVRQLRIAPARAQQTPYAQPRPHRRVRVGHDAGQSGIDPPPVTGVGFVIDLACGVRHCQPQQHVRTHAIVQSEIAGEHIAIHLEVVFGFSGESADVAAPPQGPNRAIRSVLTAP